MLIPVKKLGSFHSDNFDLSSPAAKLLGNTAVERAERMLRLDPVSRAQRMLEHDPAFRAERMLERDVFSVMKRGMEEKLRIHESLPGTQFIRRAEDALKQQRMLEGPHFEKAALAPVFQTPVPAISPRRNFQHEAKPPTVRLSLIADSRLAELRSISSPEFDFTRLIGLCEDLNAAYSSKIYSATAMLTRALLDHVPPWFGKKTFREVANNHGSKTFKKLMLHLENTARNVADAQLHMPVQKSEVLPTAQQVHFGAELDVLLAEVVRLHKR